MRFPKRLLKRLSRLSKCSQRYSLRLSICSLSLCTLLLTFFISACSNEDNDSATSSSASWTTVRPSIPNNEDRIQDNESQGENNTGNTNSGDDAADNNETNDNQQNLDDNQQNLDNQKKPADQNYELDDGYEINPPAPTNLMCYAGVKSGELLIEWDAPPENSVTFNKVRLYMAVGYGPIQARRTLAVDEVDTSREEGSRWAAHITDLPENTPLRIRVTTVDDSSGRDKESTWNKLDGVIYAGPGKPCEITDMTPSSTTASLPAPTCTAGC